MCVNNLSKVAHDSAAAGIWVDFTLTSDARHALYRTTTACNSSVSSADETLRNFGLSSHQICQENQRER